MLRTAKLHPTVRNIPSNEQKTADVLDLTGNYRPASHSNIYSVRSQNLSYILSGITNFVRTAFLQVTENNSKLRQGNSQNKKKTGSANKLMV